MKRLLWLRREPGFGRQRSLGTAGGLLVALAGTACLGAPSLHGVPVAGARSPLDSAPSPSAPDELYARRIRPLLAKNCYNCHGKEKTSGLDLRTRDSMLRGGSRGPAVVPGNPEASHLYRYVADLEKPSMPPDDSLRAGDVAALKSWIAAGAPTASGS
jgi:hypothetical protein